MNEAKTRLLDGVREFGGDHLRDLWLFDQNGHESLYLRDDVAEKVEGVDVGRHIDNERFGYVTRETYNQLNYAEYRYTIRGFDRYEQFRTFLADNGLRVGVFASFDRRDGGYDFAGLEDRIYEAASGYDTQAFLPDGNPDGGFGQ
jgi:hypothetical protein